MPLPRSMSSSLSKSSAVCIRLRHLNSNFTHESGLLCIALLGREANSGDEGGAEAKFRGHISGDSVSSSGLALPLLECGVVNGPPPTAGST